MSDEPDSDIGVTFAKPRKNPLKRAHCISKRIVVVIDDTIVKQLAIDEDNTWFEQEPTDDGILLRIRHLLLTGKPD